MNKKLLISKIKRVASFYPNMLHAYIGGSLNSPFVTEQSDIDLFIIWPSAPQASERSRFLETVAETFNSRIQWTYLDSSGEIIRDAIKLENVPKLEVYHYSIQGYEFTLENMGKMEGLDYSLSLRENIIENKSLDMFIESYLEQYKLAPAEFYFDIMKDKQNNAVGKTTLENIYRLIALATCQRIPASKHWPKLLPQIPLNHLLLEGMVLEWLSRSTEYLTTLSGVNLAPEITESDLKLLKYNPENAEMTFHVVKSQITRLAEFLSWPKKIHSLKDQLDFGEQAEAYWKQGKAFHFQIFYNSIFSGAISIHSLNFIDRSFEFGYWIDSSSEGKGLVSRGLKILMKEMSRKGWKIAKIKVSPLNIRSKKVAERMGMKCYSQSESQLHYLMNISQP